MKESFKEWLIAKLYEDLNLDEDELDADEVDADYILSNTDVDEDELATYASIFAKSCRENAQATDWYGFEEYEV